MFSSNGACIFEKNSRNRINKTGLCLELIYKLYTCAHTLRTSREAVGRLNTTLVGEKMKIGSKGNRRGIILSSKDRQYTDTRAGA